MHREVVMKEVVTVDDQATAMEELDRATCLKLRKPELRHTGWCHNCGEATLVAYCSAECREDGEKRIRFNR